jgi:hypothetical protein
MEVSRGANLVGMSMIPLDVCPHSLLIKKKKKNLSSEFDLFLKF